MKEKPLIKTNRYLRNKAISKKLLIANVSTSSLIELKYLSPLLYKDLKKKKTPKLIYSLHATK